MEAPEDKQKGELERIAEDYREGKLDKIKQELKSFVKHNKKAIQRFSRRYKFGLDCGLRQYISLRKTIHAPSEVTDQTTEIKREIWYRREKGSTKDSEEIALDWVLKHSDGWRRHRLLQILYVYVQNKEKYLAILT